jgi:prevent-host-death family protein
MTIDMTMVATEKAEPMTQEMKASEFKARCLKLMDEVRESGEEIVITKNGKPVSKLVPYRTRASSLLGLHKGVISSDDNDIYSTGESWQAEE